MTWPTGMTTTALTFADAITILEGATIAALDISLDLAGTTAIIWAATGQSIVPISDTAVVTGSTTIDLPDVDQAGIVDASGNAFTGWAYIATLTITANGQTITIQKRFQVLTGQTTVPFMSLPGGTTGTPSTVVIPAVTSVNGDTGNVTTPGGTAESIALLTGIWRGPASPTFYPSGATYQWFKTDPTSGALLDILNGVAA